ncbi:MAG: ABC transporter permease [Anaerolineae bacterium]|nr:ABC transporter permease [Anaerolineae bacterium]
MATQATSIRSVTAKRQTIGRAGLGVQIALVTWRNLITIFRTPAALIPPLAISIFFLIIYESTLGGAAGFIPGLAGNSYLAFILPLSIVSSSLSGAGIAAQNLVRDIETGYFDKLLLTPVSRAALLLGPIIALSFTHNLDGGSQRGRSRVR